jgi:cation:H+ antiporter
LLVRGASTLARAARISPLVIGLTVVAFGTSAPEFAVTLQSALTGSTDLALGSVIGSNVANTLLILGACALVTPLVVSSQVVRYHVPIMIVASFLLYFMCLDGSVGTLDGIWLFGALIAYNVWSIRRSRTENHRDPDDKNADRPTLRYAAFRFTWLLAGVGLLALGARWMVGGALTVSLAFGFPELVVGLTVVALGTSLPERVASLTATRRHQTDMAVGNVVGSNLFNILGVLGLAAIVAPGGIPVSDQALRLDLPFMIAAAAATLPIFLTGSRISRAEGAVFLGYYISYISYLVLEAVHPAVSRNFGVIMTGFVIPLSAMALLVSWTRWRRSRSAAVEDPA